MPVANWSSKPYQSLTLTEAHASNVCAKLVTITRDGRKEVIVLRINKPVAIGRNPSICSYVVSDIVVSNVHCKLYAIPSSTGGIIVSCQDMSTNGIILNGERIRKASVILMDSDVLQIPSSQSFKCFHISKEPREKAHIFDPTPPLQASSKHIAGYVVTSHCLGSGSFATVHLAVDTRAHRQVACKSIKTKKDGEMMKVMKEVDILLALNHPNINKVYNMEIDGKFLHIFLQLCTGGDLFTYISNRADTNNRLGEGEAKYIMYQLLKGLAYLHNKSISHRDLKPENILLHCPGPYPRILIADFGLARPRSYQETLNVCGTVAYLPPEGILALDNKHLGYVGMPADCWSAGVILFIMLSGCHPFDYSHTSHSRASSEYFDSNVGTEDFDDSQFSQMSAHSEMVIKKRIVNGEMQFLQYIWNNMPDAKALVGRLLIHSHLHRATVYSALESRWITSDLAELHLAYEDRMGVN